MRNYSSMTRQQYRRIQSLRSRDLHQNRFRAPQQNNSFREPKIQHLTRHLNRMIVILIVLIIAVYLVLLFINF